CNNTSAISNPARPQPASQSGAAAGPDGPGDTGAACFGRERVITGFPFGRFLCEAERGCRGECQQTTPTRLQASAPGWRWGRDLVRGQSELAGRCCRDNLNPVEPGPTNDVVSPARPG